MTIKLPIWQIALRSLSADWEHESLYDPDEDAEDLEDDADEEETDHKGSFAGSVLLSKAEWDKEQLIRDLRERMGHRGR